MGRLAFMATVMNQWAALASLGGGAGDPVREQIAVLDASISRLRDELQQLSAKVDAYHREQMQYMAALAGLIGVDTIRLTRVEDRIREIQQSVDRAHIAQYRLAYDRFSDEAGSLMRRCAERTAKGEPAATPAECLRFYTGLAIRHSTSDTWSPNPCPFPLPFPERFSDIAACESSILSSIARLVASEPAKTGNPFIWQAGAAGLLTLMQRKPHAKPTDDELLAVFQQGRSIYRALALLNDLATWTKLAEPYLRAVERLAQWRSAVRQSFRTISASSGPRALSQALSPCKLTGQTTGFFNEYFRPVVPLEFVEAEKLNIGKVALCFDEVARSPQPAGVIPGIQDRVVDIELHIRFVRSSGLTLNFEAPQLTARLPEFLMDSGKLEDRVRGYMIGTAQPGRFVRSGAVPPPEATATSRNIPIRLAVISTV